MTRATAPPLTSIRDVAREAGVSVTTVSHALHGTRHVAPRTVARVQEIAARLSYSPNRTARALRTQRTRSVAVLVASLRNPAIAAYVDGAEEALGAAGYTFALTSHHLRPDQEERSLSLVRQLQADGLIVVAPSDHLRSLLARRLNAPLALINALPKEEPVDLTAAGVPVVAAVVDEAAAAQRATEHLIGLRHRRIALVRRGAALWGMRQRLEGYRRALLAAGIAFDPTLAVELEPPEGDAAPLLRGLLDLPDPPTAMYVAHNLAALRVVAALSTLGVRVPDEVALVVSAAEDWTEAVRPRLTAVEVPEHELGVVAAQLLLRQLEPGSGDAREACYGPVRVLNAPLIVRESSGAVRAAPVGAAQSQSQS